MAQIKIFTPGTMNAPRSPYLQVARVAASEYVFIAGQVAVDKEGNLCGEDDFEKQCDQVFANIELALKSVGAGWQNVVEFTNYVVRPQDVGPLKAYRTREFPRMFANGTYPPSTLLVISRLANPAYLLEIKTIAAL